MFPVGDLPAFDESSTGSSGFLALFRPFGCAFILNIADHQPQGLNRGFVVGKLHAVAGGFPQLVVHRFDGIGRIDDLSGHGWKLQNGTNRSQASRHTFTDCGYFSPNWDSANSSNAARAVVSSGAV